MNASIDPVAQGRTHTTHRPGVRQLGLVFLAGALLVTTACDSSTAATITTGASTSPVVTAIDPVVNSTSTALAEQSTVPATISPRPTATIDELTGPSGVRVHVRCVGHGDTTVVLIAGFGGDTTGWAEVEPVIAARARVCSYDRPGTGTSDPATSSSTFATQASDLHALLQTIGEPGPYLVVGHSFGGAEAVTFASHFADEVTGLVLVDASPTDWPTVLCAVPDDGTTAATMVRSTCSTFTPTGNGEHLDVHAAFAEASQIDSLGALPMAVITATRRELPAGLAAPEVTRLTNSWNDGQQAWAALSTAARLVSVDHTGHHIEIDQPGVVIDEITRLLP
jgi:pimeloyl-ACP methyl ester carboxylesterase